MLNITEKTKIYVHCPSGAVTGGAELLHQLVDVINNNGGEGYIVYFGNSKHCIPEDYQKYNIKVSEKIEDNPNNVEVIYEGYYKQSFINKNIQKVLWWLSVDNYYRAQLNDVSIKELFIYNPKIGFKQLVKSLLGRTKFKRVVSLGNLKKLGAINCYQSEYAQHFLINKGFKYTFNLKDFINVEHFSSLNIANKEDIILYNPKKGLKFTKKIIKFLPNFKWVPIQNMSRSEVIALMQKAKLYIDFGYHPGKDRLPRECAMNGCCIITGLEGSAAFFEDVMIDENNKFKNKRSNLKKIANRIEEIMKDYPKIIKEFNFYRERIKKEKKEFEESVKELFDLDKG